MQRRQIISSGALALTIPMIAHGSCTELPPSTKEADENATN